MRGIRECLAAGLCIAAAITPALASAASPAPTKINAPNGVTFDLRPAAACWPDHGGVACYHRNSGEWVKIRPDGSKPKVTYAPTGILFPKKKLGANQWTDIRSGVHGVFCVDTRPEATHVACLGRPDNPRWVVLIEVGQFHVVDSKAPVWKFWNRI